MPSRESDSHSVEILPFTELLWKHIDFLRMSLDPDKECWNKNKDVLQLDTLCGIIIFRTTLVKKIAANKKQQGINFVFLITCRYIQKRTTHTQRTAINRWAFSMLLIYNSFPI